MIQHFTGMANMEKLYQHVASQILLRCHGGIKIIKHGKILEVYDPQRHIWSKGLAGLVIREECTKANLRDWEVANVRRHVIQKLLDHHNA